MSRILFVGDSHGDLDFLDAACAHAADNGCDRVLQVGDFGLWPPAEHADRWLTRLDQVVTTHGLDAIHWLDGNHDWHDRLADYRATAHRDDDGFIICAPAERVRYADRGHRWSWNGIRFGALGGAYSIDWRGRTRYVSWWPDEQPSDKDYQHLVEGSPLDVLVTHDSPLGVEFGDTGFYLPSRDQEQADETRRKIRMAVNRLGPCLLVHGHWHIRNTKDLHTAHLVDGARREFTTRVESLAANINDHPDAWLVVDLEELHHHLSLAAHVRQDLNADSGER